MKYAYTVLRTTKRQAVTKKYFSHPFRHFPLFFSIPFFPFFHLFLHHKVAHQIQLRDLERSAVSFPS